jgi:hypothetical protein
MTASTGREEGFGTTIPRAPSRQRHKEEDMARMLFATLAVIGLSIAIPGEAHAQTAAKSTTVAGTVRTVTTQSLVITSAGKDMTFAVDGTTQFIAKGLSTKSAKGKIMATDAVAANDLVRVTYRESGGGILHAATVRVTQKGAAK